MKKINNRIEQLEQEISELKNKKIIMDQKLSLMLGRNITTEELKEASKIYEEYSKILDKIEIKEQELQKEYINLEHALLQRPKSKKQKIKIKR